MLVNIVPPTADVHLSAVVFSVIFEDLAPELANPPLWTNLLQVLRRDELEIPESIHAFDKAAGIICLLEEVTFDLSTKVISCQFLDGSTEQWPFAGTRCAKALERIVLDVNESSLDIEREREQEKQREREKERKRLESISPSSTIKVSRHKKQRSLLMTLVASIIPLYSPSSHSRLPSPPPTPVSERKPSPSISPRARRRRARSELVDAFRRYALTELSRRFPNGGYYSWIIQSMLRKAMDSMERLIKQAGGLSPVDTDSVFHYYPEEPEFFSITAASLPPTPSVSDDDGETFDTDTDGSSIHTPSSPHFQTFRHVPHPSGYFPKRHNYVSGSPRRFLSESNHALYTQQAQLTSRLRRLLILDNTRQEQEAEDLKHHFNVLEIRSRRRAWLNKALAGGTRNENSDMGMAMPFRSSPLAQRSWTSEEYEYAPDEVLSPQEWPEYDEYDRVELKMKRTRRCTITTRLFPVSEVVEGEDNTEDEDEALDARELQLQFDGFEVDLEGGVRCEEDDHDDAEDGAGMRVAFEIERPQVRPRVRTSSMYKHRLHVPPPGGLGHVALPPQHQLTSSSLLCQPLTGPLNMPHPEVADLSQPPIYTEVDVNLNVGQLDVTGYGGFGKYSEEEFTLAMDLPISVRVQDRGVLANRRRLSVDSDHAWFSSRLSEPRGILRCR
ncbi:hypothetical protein D9615_002035 [Tricholomella constricta]|uniref:Uncharacterized protein n=1 Tax=Tricholomella constricta TaxID=117010 RepID=A0A8H5HNR5_9AGAR|nr:hypothetical protein D9615_002035 [Tricholomella constricta]